MTTLSVPITPQIEENIEELIQKGYGSNKADIVRKALRRLAEEEAINAVLRAEQEVREGKILRGDLRDLVKKVK